MDVEDADTKLKKKALFFTLIITFVIIIGLIVAIVVLANLKNQSTDPGPEISGTYTDKSMEIYEDTTTTILEQTTDSSDINDTIATYRVYIAKTDDGGAKALLYTDYYMILLSLDTSLAMKDEIISGLIAADEIIQNASSALAVSNAATYYQDTELSTEYQNLANSRMKEKNE